MHYFVKESEISSKGRNARTAGLLSIFLGSLGIHRFYLGRKLSGSLILASTLLSFGISIFIWIPFTFIEGLVLLSKYRSHDNSPITSNEPVTRISEVKTN